MRHEVVPSSAVWHHMGAAPIGIGPHRVVQSRHHPIFLDRNGGTPRNKYTHSSPGMTPSSSGVMSSRPVRW